MILIASILIAGCFDESKTRLEGIEVSQVRDGDYTGECDAGIIAAKVLVKVRGHQIMDIQVIEHRTGRGAPAEALTSKVIAQQTLKVDAITGATSSSKVIIKAIEDALKKGR